MIYTETTCLTSAGYQILIPGCAAVQAFLIPVKVCSEIKVTSFSLLDIRHLLTDGLENSIMLV